jgi:hypothetical protein
MAVSHFDTFSTISPYLPRHLVKLRLKSHDDPLHMTRGLVGTVMTVELRGGVSFWTEVEQGREVALSRRRKELEDFGRLFLEEGLLRFDGILVRGDATILLCFFPGRSERLRERSGGEGSLEDFRFSAQRAISCALQVLGGLEGGKIGVADEAAVGIAGGVIWEGVLGDQEQAIYLAGGPVPERARIAARSAPPGRVLVENETFRFVEDLAAAEELAEGKLLSEWRPEVVPSERPFTGYPEREERWLEETVALLEPLLPMGLSEMLRKGEAPPCWVDGMVLRAEARAGSPLQPGSEAEPVIREWAARIVKEAREAGARIAGAAGIGDDGAAVLLFLEGAEEAQDLEERLVAAGTGLGSRVDTAAGTYILGSLGTEWRQLLFLEPLSADTRL